MKIRGMEIQGAIFDIDGTLLDSMPIWQDVTSRYLESQGITPEPNLGELIFHMSLKEGIHYVKEYYHLAKSEQEMEDGVVALIRHFYYEEAPLKQGVREFVQRLASKKIPMMLATSGDRDLATHALDRLGLLQDFLALYTCDMFATNKREPKIFQLAQQKMEQENGHPIPTEKIFVFEDSISAIHTAMDAGFQTVGIFDMASSGAWEEIKESATLYISGMDELI
ncbi:MAG: HAD family hydrolase [Lachnospiraceae bacterium]